MSGDLHSGDLGMQRSRIAPLLTGEDLAELLALADFCISSGGSLHFSKPSNLAIRLKALRLVEWVSQPGLGRGAKLRRLTELGWLTLLTRAKSEMRHLLPAEVEVDDVGLDVATVVKDWLTTAQPDAAPLPPLVLDWSQRRFSHCQANEDDCTYAHCPRWRDGKVVNEAHCALDLIGRDDDC